MAVSTAGARGDRAVSVAPRGAASAARAARRAAARGARRGARSSRRSVSWRTRGAGIWSPPPGSRAGRFALAPAHEQEYRIDRWGRLVAALAGSSGVVRRVGWVSRSIPSEVNLQLDYFEEASDRRAGPDLRDSYLELLERYAATADQREVLVWIAAARPDRRLLDERLRAAGRRAACACGGCWRGRASASPRCLTGSSWRWRSAPGSTRSTAPPARSSPPASGASFPTRSRTWSRSPPATWRSAGARSPATARCTASRGSSSGRPPTSARCSACR